MASFPTPQGFRPPTPPADRNNGGAGLLYPTDLITAKRQFYIQVQVSKYDRPTVFLPPNLLPINTITLPIPIKINDVNTVVWEPEGITTMAASAVIEGTVGLLNIFGKQAAKKGLALAGNIAEHLVPALAAVGGIAVNPYLTMLFKTQNFKDHTFEWTFAPNNAQDSNNLQAILLFLKKYMYPTHPLPFVMGYPAIMKIRLFAVGIDGNNFLYQFKPAVLTSLGIDRSAGAQPSFHVDGSPQVVGVVMNFQEIEMWFNEDFSEPGANTTGL